ANWAASETGGPHREDGLARPREARASLTQAPASRAGALTPRTIAPGRGRSAARAAPPAAAAAWTPTAASAPPRLRAPWAPGRPPGSAEPRSARGTERFGEE